MSLARRLLAVAANRYPTPMPRPAEMDGAAYALLDRRGRRAARATIYAVLLLCGAWAIEPAYAGDATPRDAGRAGDAKSLASNANPADLSTDSLGDDDPGDDGPGDDGPGDDGPGDDDPGDDKSSSLPEPNVADKPSEISPLATTGPKPAPITPPTLDEIDASILRGVDFLLETQREHGAWGGPQRTKSLNIYAPVPGSHRAFRTGVTSLVLMALCDVRPLLDGDRLERVERAIDRGQQWLFENASRLRRAEAEALYNVWGHAYACHAIRRLHDRAEGDQELQARLIKLLEYQVNRLERYTFVNGGWGYYDFAAHTRTPSGSPTSFTTATALIALKDAAELGVHYPEALSEKAIDSILRQRLPDFSYAYGEYLRMAPRYGINRPAGSLGRSQACNLALRVYGREEVTDEVIKTWLDRLYARNGWLSIGRKYPVPHESHFGVAGYFYYYGHFYAALCIEVLPVDEQPHFQEHLAHILIPLQEKDGSWWDYPLYDYHQQWGTAMAVSSLLRCRGEATTP